MTLNLKHLYKPYLVGTFLGSSKASSQIKNALQARCDVLEVRLDSIPEPHHLKTLALIKKSIKAPLLLTDRSYDESGRKVPQQQRLSDAERWIRLQRVMTWADIIDVEISHEAYASQVTTWAHRQKKVVIHSYHVFKNIGKHSDFLKRAQISRRLKGDIFKYAGMPRRDKEVQQILQWGLELASQPKIVIAMGSLGEVSRYLGFTFGSLLTYGHLGVVAAPGQPSVAELRQGIDRIYGHR